MHSKILNYKVVICGKTYTGKTSIIKRYTNHQFIEMYFASTLPMTVSHEYKDQNGKYQLDIWDTAGAEEWQSLNTHIYHGSHVIIFVAAYNSKESIKEIVEKWLPLLNESVGPDEYIPILAINKIDIEDEAEIPTEEEIEEIRKALNAELFYVSAKENKNISELFDYAAMAVRKKFAPVVEVIDVNNKNHCC